MTPLAQPATGVEAVAWGLADGGVEFTTAYPGFHAHEMADDVRHKAEQLGDTAHDKAMETKQEALNVISSLKGLLASYTSSSNLTDMKNQILEKAMSLKGVVKDEVSHAYETGKERTLHTVQEKPIASVIVAVSAGVIIGYLLSSRRHNRTHY